MKKFYLFLMVLICFALLQRLHAQAAGGADYGRGPETDPVASAAVSALTTNLNGANIKSGNIPIAALTNAAASIGPSIGGNIPVGAISSAAGSVGSSIGGNIPVAALTNAAASLGPNIGGNIPVAVLTNAVTGLAGASITNTCIAADGKTNTYVFVSFGGKYVISSITTSP